MSQFVSVDATCLGDLTRYKCLFFGYIQSKVAALLFEIAALLQLHHHVEEFLNFCLNFKRFGWTLNVGSSCFCFTTDATYGKFC